MWTFVWQCDVFETQIRMEIKLDRKLWKTESQKHLNVYFLSVFWIETLNMSWLNISSARYQPGCCILSHALFVCLCSTSPGKCWLALWPRVHEQLYIFTQRHGLVGAPPCWWRSVRTCVYTTSVSHTSSFLGRKSWSRALFLDKFLLKKVVVVLKGRLFFFW